MRAGKRANSPYFHTYFQVCLIFFGFLPKVTLAGWPHADYIVESFLEIALKSEYSKKAKSVRKWPTQGIHYRYVHRVADKGLHEELSELHLRHLQLITGLPIKPANTPKNANLLIVFSQEQSLKNDLQRFFGIQSSSKREYLFRHSVCLGHFSTNATGAIQKAVVIIPVDRARGQAKLIDCIVEELTQILGLPNDSEKVFPSIFNDRSIDQLLSGLDYILLKILYDPLLIAGMDETNARPVVAAIVARLINNGVVGHADSKVRQGGLYPLLYSQPESIRITDKKLRY